MTQLLNALNKIVSREPWLMKFAQFRHPEGYLPARTPSTVRLFHSTDSATSDILSNGLRTGSSLGLPENAPVVFATTRPQTNFGQTVVAFDAPASDVLLSPERYEARVIRPISPSEIKGIMQLGYSDRGFKYNWDEARWKQEYDDYIRYALSQKLIHNAPQ